MTTTPNLLPTFSHPTEPENWAELPFHVYDIESRMCNHCSEKADLWENTYEEYTTNWYATEYEGEPGHEPLTEEDYYFLASTCWGTDS